MINSKIKNNNSNVGLAEANNNSDSQNLLFSIVETNLSSNPLSLIIKEGVEKKRMAKIEEYLKRKRNRTDTLSYNN